MCISRIIEELFPFGHYFVRYRRLRKQRDCQDVLRKETFSEYETLCSQLLTQRLEEEHRRASVINEKTFKLTFSLSMGLTALGLMAAFLTTIVTSVTLQIILVVMIGISLFYILAAGFVAVGALRTVRTYGYGTHFQMKLKEHGNSVLADALARQEIMNIIAHLRNETAYQALRNGLLLLFMAIFLFFVVLACQLSSST